MTATYVRCRHTRGNRTQECVLVLLADRMACIPIAPPENAIGQIAAGLAMTAVGMFMIRDRAIDLRQLAAVGDLDALVGESGGFFVGADWAYRTQIPIVGTMLTRGDENLSTRERVPPQMLARLTPNRAPLSSKPVKVTLAIGAGLLAVAGIAYLATGSLEALFGIGFWGVLVIATGLFVWLRLRASSAPSRSGTS